ncbi:hypothetical protein C8Q76DRAFT_723985 [Earliella scabrosa]|nr:hypothetical protein C8Q76DRAFT_723985 [Earliella scabrosa]
MEMRLMVEVEAESPSGGPTIAVDGRHWQLTPPLDITSTTFPPYACASYVWGPDRAPNPIHPSIAMSDRTLTTFAAVARHARPHARAIWIDAFCVPTEPRAKRATLESMGFIYARASAVVVVLASQSLAAVREMEQVILRRAEQGPSNLVIPPEPLAVLDADEWIRSVWTYQEVVNSQMLLFASTTLAEEPVHGQEVLNIVGHYVTLYRSGRSSDTFSTWSEWLNSLATSQRFRRVLDFEHLLADYLIGEYAERSAYVIMTGLQVRSAISPANHFYSMIGALTDKPSSRATYDGVEALSERFMALCEEKGDYSFIFSSGPRDTRPGLRWRPMPGILQSVLAWHSYGAGQLGTRVDGGVLLKNVAVFASASRNKGWEACGLTGQTFIRTWMSGLADSEEDDLLELTRRALTEGMKFTGVGGRYVTGSGIFYAQDQLPEGLATICVSQGVRFTCGAPGLARVDVGEDFAYSPGVFVGDVGVAGPTRRASSVFLLQ